MKPPQTLRSRIAFYFCGYLAILLTVYTAALSGMLKKSEDRTFNQQLTQIAGRLIGHVQEQGKLPDYLPMHITAYIDLTQIPLDLQQFVKNHAPGIFEIESHDIDYHVVLTPIPSTGQLLYVFYDVRSIETTDRFESFMLLALIGIALGVLILGWILARSLANRILNPISTLANTVQNLSLNEDRIELSTFNTADEVGTLAKKIDQLLRRIADFTRREREFTSHA
ncbi:MAG: sensor histidine kinase, partial [Desulfobacteraceae bacterium]